MPKPLPITNLIPSGHENRIGRKYLIQKCVKEGIIPEGSNDKERILRKLVEEARMSGVVVCNDDGYFMPSGVADAPYLDKYIRRNEHQAKAIFATLNTAKRLREDYERGRIVS